MHSNSRIAGAILSVALLTVFYGSPVKSQPTPSIRATFSPEALRMRALGKAALEAGGETFDGVYDLSSTFPPVKPLIATNNFHSVAVPLHELIMEAFESRGLLFLVCDSTPIMGVHSYILLVFDGVKLSDVHMGAEATFMHFVSENAQAATLEVTDSHGESSYHVIANGLVTRTRNETASVPYDRVYAPNASCTVNTANNSNVLFVFHSSTNKSQVVLSKKLLAQASAGTSLQRGVKAYCRGFGSAALVWLVGKGGGLSYVFANDRLSPLFDRAPVRITPHFLFYKILQNSNDPAAPDGYLFIKS